MESTHDKVLVSSPVDARLAERRGADGYGVAYGHGHRGGERLGAGEEAVRTIAAEQGRLDADEVALRLKQRADKVRGTLHPICIEHPEVPVNPIRNEEKNAW